MTLLSAWKDSLSVFSPKKLKLFLLVTANTVKQSHMIFFRYWWWLALLLYGLAAYNYLLNSFSYFFPIAVLISFFLALFTFFLSMRPSVERKNYSYFAKYYAHLFYALLGSAIFFVFLFAPFSSSFWFKYRLKIISAESHTLLSDAYNFVLLVGFHYIITSLLFVGWIFFMMFLLDGNGSLLSPFYSLWRAAKMVLYSMPFILVSFLLVRFNLFLLFLMFLSFVPNVYVTSMFPLCFLNFTFWICFYANFYIQKVHEQYKLYFKD